MKAIMISVCFPIENQEKIFGVVSPYRYSLNAVPVAMQSKSRHQPTAQEMNGIG